MKKLSLSLASLLLVLACSSAADTQCAEGMRHRSEGDGSLAIACFMNALQYNPDHMEANAELGEMLAVSDPEKAAGHINKASSSMEKSAISDADKARLRERFKVDLAAIEASKKVLSH